MPSESVTIRRLMELVDELHTSSFQVIFVGAIQTHFTFRLALDDDTPSAHTPSSISTCNHHAARLLLPHGRSSCSGARNSHPRPTRKPRRQGGKSRALTYFSNLTTVLWDFFSFFFCRSSLGFMIWFLYHNVSMWVDSLMNGKKKHKHECFRPYHARPASNTRSKGSEK